MFSKALITFAISAALGMALIIAPKAVSQEYYLKGQGAVNAGRSAASYRPWTTPGFRGYREPAASMQLINPSAAHAEPRKYEVYAHVLPVKSKDPNSADLIAHVPDHAEVFLGGTLMSPKGETRVFFSPPLAPGSYVYTVRVNWIEEGKRVTQTHDVIVKPGETSCFYLIEKGAGFDTPKEIIAASLAKLTPEDRKLAESQKFCAVQNGVALGAMGAPTKIDINGQPVFVCCPACTERARSNPAKTLAAAAQLRENASATTK
jgi:uncharacterized protein (TIGR03000 family)